MTGLHVCIVWLGSWTKRDREVGRVNVLNRNKFVCLEGAT